VLKSHFAFRNYTRACVHHNIRVNITQENITFVSVIITVIRVNIALCVYKSHSCVLISHFAFQNYTCACDYHIMRVNISVCMWKSHYACVHAECGFNTYECHNHTHTCQHHTLVCVEITVVSVVITFVRVTACGNNTHLRIEIITLCVWTSHYACEHHTMRVNITQCVRTSHYACKQHTMRVNITWIRWTPVLLTKNTQRQTILRLYRFLEFGLVFALGANILHI
jgi:hypothetical protein